MSNPVRRVLIILSLSMAALSISCSENQIQEVSYDLVEGWAELPEGVEAWGQTIGVEIDTGGNLLVFQRCFASNCIGRDEVPAFLKYNSDGQLVDSYRGKELADRDRLRLVSTHGQRICYRLVASQDR